MTLAEVEVAKLLGLQSKCVKRQMQRVLSRRREVFFCFFRSGELPETPVPSVSTGLPCGAFGTLRREAFGDMGGSMPGAPSPRPASGPGLGPPGVVGACHGVLALRAVYFEEKVKAGGPEQGVDWWPWSPRPRERTHPLGADGDTRASQIQDWVLQTGLFKLIFFPPETCFRKEIKKARCGAGGGGPCSF